MSKNLAYFTEENSADTVIARMNDAKDARLRQVMDSVIRHLHAVVKEVEPTQEEWMAALEFLTEVGQMSDEHRQEYILLSDTLGVSMLTDAINNRKPTGATESTVLGPFHFEGVPERENGANICLDGKGVPLIVSGRVTDSDGKPIAGAKLDVWQANGEGFYDVQQKGIQPDNNLRGVFTTDADGRYWFKSVNPAHYPIPHDGPVGRLLERLGRHPFRPGHVHFIVGAEGHIPVTTHIFRPDDPYIDSDTVFGVKESLVREFVHHDDQAEAAKLEIANPYWSVESDFTLVRAGA